MLEELRYSTCVIFKLTYCETTVITEGGIGVEIDLKISGMEQCPEINPSLIFDESTEIIQ